MWVSTRRSGVLSVSAVAVLSVLVGAFVPVAHAAAPPVAAPAARANPDARCTLSSSLRTTRTENASCLGVGLDFPEVPDPGREAALVVTVRSGRSEPGTVVTVDLPPTLTFADGVATTAVETGAGPATRGVLATVDLAAGDTETFRTVVTAVGTGAGEVAAQASAVVSPTRTDVGADRLLVDPGDPRGAAAAADGSVPHPAVVLPSGTPVVVDPVVARRPHAPLPPPSDGRSATPSATASVAPASATPASPSPGQSCVSGLWTFRDATGTYRPGYGTYVRVRRNGGSAPVLTAGFTAPDGTYVLCWGNTGSNSSVYVEYVEGNSAFQVIGSGDAFDPTTFLPWRFTIPAFSVAPGTQQTTGLVSAADPEGRAVHVAYDAAVMYDWMYATLPDVGGCFSPTTSSCKPVFVSWTPDSTTGTFYEQGGFVRLLADSPDSEDEPVHEMAHALMYHLYRDGFPDHPNCKPHYLLKVSSSGCAWTEGFADWVALSVWGNTTWTFGGGGVQEGDVGYDAGSARGDQVEGRVAVALYGLDDGVVAPFDNYPGDHDGDVAWNSGVIRTLAQFRPPTFSAYWNARSMNGQDTGQGPLSALYRATIDYGFRNPLVDDVPKQLPPPSPVPAFSATTHVAAWSAVAMKPAAGTGADLQVYSDFFLQNLLKKSTFGGDATDFVAINSNAGHVAQSTFYPTVTPVPGNTTGGYDIVLAQGSPPAMSGTRTVTFAAGQPLTIADVAFTAGKPVSFRATPAADTDVRLGVIGADAGVVSRVEMTDISKDFGTGNSAVLTYTPKVSGDGALVLIDESRTTSPVTVYQDDSAPTGSVSIDGGAATTSSTSVGLTLSAGDPDTGVTGMRISTDGVFDTEKTVPFATSAAVTLPKGNGTKTVWVRYENAVGFTSTATDTIELHAAPTVTAVSPASGPLGGGTTITLTGIDLTGADVVLVGNKQATDVTVVDDHTVTAVTPGGDPGYLKVQVQTPYGLSPPSSKITFRYQGPVVAGITPSVGPVSGGTKVFLDGSGFSTTTQVLVGGTSVPFTVVSDRRVQLRTPPAPGPGPVEIVVQTRYGQSLRGQNTSFTYR